jgi:parvulin-like peptidyl-prolyl isomerase
VIMTNGDSGGALATEILRTIAYEYKWPDFAPREIAEWEGTVDQKVLARYVGTYALMAGANMLITLEGTQLSEKLGEQPTFPIFPESETMFFLKVVDAQIEFVKDASGAVTALVLHQGGRDQKAPRLSDKAVQARSQVNKGVQAFQSALYPEANKPIYQVPAKRDLGILIVDQAKLEQTIQPTEADLLRVYNDNKDTYRLPERVDVQHILLKTDDKDPNKSDAAIKPKAEDLVKQLQKPGVNFSEMAKKYSEDPGSKENGGEYDGVVRGQMVPEFEKAAFSLKVGEISAPVKTTYGYHILKVLKHEQAQLKPFNDVKAQMEAEFKKQRVNDLMQQLSDKVQAALTKDPLHPDKVAADLGVQYVVAANVGQGDPLPEVGVNKEFEEAVSGLKKGDVSQPVVLTGNTQIAMAVCTGEIPAHPSSFDEVQSKVRDAVGKDKLAKLVAAVAHFTTAVELDPNFITARLYLATAYMQQYIPGGDSPDNLQMAKAAYDQFQEVLTRDPNNEMAVASIASLLFNEKKLDESNEWNLKLIALNPKNKEAYYTLGVIAWTKAWVVDGEARTKLGMKPEDPGPLKDKKVRAEVGAKNGPIIDEGFRDLDKALQIDPEYDDAMAYENLLYRQKADLEDSSDAYKADIDKANDYFQKTIDTRKIKAERTCVEEATARSPNVATQPVNIRITNQRSNASKIYWLNQQGQRVFYMTLESGAFYTQPTYSEHPWVATDNDGHCTMFFVATTAPHQEVTIRRW